MAKTKEWRRSITWKCLVCAGEPEFEHAAMMEHMQKVHGFDPKTAKANKTTLMCLDGQGFYQNTFEYEVNGMKFLKYEHGERT